MFRLKICGITTIEDAAAAVRAGADALGFNFHPPSPRFVTREAALGIRRTLPSSVAAIGVFVDRPAAELVEAQRALGLDLVQLHGQEPPALADALPGRIVRALRIRDAASLDSLREWAGAAAVLLDGIGGARTFGGATFDWELAAAARRVSTLPLVLAGGLTPENVAAAVRAVRPDAVDVASGVEDVPGRKSEARMRAFVEAALAAMEER